MKGMYLILMSFLNKINCVYNLKVKETIETGLENAGKAFVSMMNGGNTGKQLLKI